jgi:serine/threonine protein kinase
VKPGMDCVWCVPDEAFMLLRIAFAASNWNRFVLTVQRDDGLKRKFDVLGRVAKRSHGFVYIARDAVSRSFVVLKTGQGLSDSVWHEEDMYALLRGCKGVPSLLWSGMAIGERVLALDVAGVPLSQLRFCLSPAELHNYAGQLVRVLQRIHARGVLHCDIKPHNLILRNGEVHIVDFGSAVQKAKAAEWEFTGAQCVVMLLWFTLLTGSSTPACRNACFRI